MASIKGIEELGVRQRINYGSDLVVARNYTTALERELPIVHAGYSNSLKSYLRLFRIARTQHSHGLRASVIVDASDIAIGMATVQNYLPTPCPDELTRLPGRALSAAEASYWHLDAQTMYQATKLGVGIMELLMRQAEKSFGAPDSPVWAVSLPDDSVKAKVYEEVGLAPINEPTVYDLGDAVSAPRQLWALVG